jgi:hypothetical protein
MLDRYNLERPTADDLVGSLRTILGQSHAETAIGLAARDALSSATTLDELSPEQLLLIARALVRQRGLCAIIGRSFEIRLQSYLELATQHPEVDRDHG